MIVVDWRLSESEPGILKALYHLNADGSAGGAKAHAVVTGPTYQPEVAVHVPDLYAERQPHQPTIDPPDYNSMKRIGAADLVAVHDVHVAGHKRNELFQLAYVVLCVTVRVKDPLLGRAVKPRTQRATVAAVHRMVNYSKLRIDGLQLRQYEWGVITATIVDHDHFVVIRQLSECSVRQHDHARDGSGIVIGRKKNANSRIVSHLLAGPDRLSTLRPTGPASSPKLSDWLYWSRLQKHKTDH